MEIANKDIIDLTGFILSELLKTPHIQKHIVAKALMGELYGKSADRRHACLAALNRMHELVDCDDNLERLEQILEEKKVDKVFVASILRTAGKKGEEILLKQLKQNKDFTVRNACASVLFYRLPKEKERLRVELESDGNSLPGTFCRYSGKISPLVYEKESSNDLLIVNPRDFMASLQRMLCIPFYHKDPIISFDSDSLTVDKVDLDYQGEGSLARHLEYFRITEEEGDCLANDSGRLLVNKAVIRGLAAAMSDESDAVRDTAASSIGSIGLPEAQLAVVSLVELSKDKDVNIKAKAICSLGRIAESCSTEVIKRIFDATECNMWKVKSAALYALSCFGHRAVKFIPRLIEMLKDPSINKQTVAETVIKLGPKGEKTLIDLLKKKGDDDFKLKSSVVKAFALIDIGSANLDFALEVVFKAAESKNKEVRKCSLFALNSLALKGKDFCQYLKSKALVPVYYKALSDRDSSIRKVIF